MNYFPWEMENNNRWVHSRTNAWIRNT